MTSPLAPYAIDHEDPNGPGDARPTALKIIRDQGLDGTLSGKVFFISGGTNGIGVETARAIHATGADVYITGQNRKKGLEVVEHITGDGKPGKVMFLEMFLDSLESVRDTAKRFLELSGGKVNVLITNAGIRGYPKDKTKDGFEQHFGVNHLGHFALFHALKDALLSSSTPSVNSRVVVLSAAGHRQSKIRFDDYNFDIRPEEYQPLLGYAQSKLANIYMATEIERRFSAQGLHATAVNPGLIPGTGLNKKTPPEQLAQMWKMTQLRNLLKSVEQGAATTIWAAVGKEWEGKGGKFLENAQVSPPADESKGPLSIGYAEYAYDVDAAKRLWEDSLRMVGSE
ncbi:short-chain dehydrogenase, putative [Talaromyces stipitatus ATCC 10500]|uniref:Short-chain dehydrogenase, putative n=1 Tax=Talaromyces stipitatus (strain ATCC 10500 / CBS 375.48 / QM 6759 / NRRL 1006) TaxID=441959 RepID=B8MTI3_TALSN|nr:short-chain dehydrogenase, putative [Talaromyces stipitatus ATCC 10500]EED12389.1 short-chain dehydrogenase, putative [Talaromyces stipitatus ATCC 10500]